MAKKRKTRHAKVVTTPTDDSQSTVIWGKEVEAEDFIKVPRAFLRLSRYLTAGELKDIKPRHLMLILALAGWKFQRKPIRAYWEQLADDLGVKKDTVRKWAYELREKGLLVITQHRGRDPKKHGVGYKNDRNSFDIGPFVRLVDKAYKIRLIDRKKRDGQEDKDES